VAQVPLNFDYLHTYQINGEESSASATGSFDFSSGSLTYTGLIDHYFFGYRRWWVSPVTLAMLSGSPLVSLERDGAQNLYTLTDGTPDYTIVVRTKDQFADLTTQINLTRANDTVRARLTTQGTASYPEIVGIQGPLKLFQTPLPQGGFVEEGVKRLIADDGMIIDSVLTAEFMGVNLPRPQIRDVNLTVLEESGDFLRVMLRLDSIVTPVPKGDFDGNGLLDASDIDLLSASITEVPELCLTPNPPEWCQDVIVGGRRFDVNQDGTTNDSDRGVWIKELRKTWIGDANMDGEFSSADFVSVFQIGEYEDGIVENSTWSKGDWNGDFDFTSSDFVQAFQDGGYEKGPRAAGAAVPEPASFAMVMVGLVAVACCRRCQGRPNPRKQTI
jgi:hypothetical protein